MPLSNLTIVAADGTWVVRAGGAVIADSDNALELFEGDAPSVVFFPREDLGMAFLEPSDKSVHQAGLGQASFYDVVTRSEVIPAAAWSYESPEPGAERLAGFVSFDPRRVTLEEV